MAPILRISFIFSSFQLVEIYSHAQGPYHNPQGSVSPELTSLLHRDISAISPLIWKDLDPLSSQRPEQPALTALLPSHAAPPVVIFGGILCRRAICCNPAWLAPFLTRSNSANPKMARTQPTMSEMSVKPSQLSSLHGSPRRRVTRERAAVRRGSGLERMRVHNWPFSR
jgi:hypothetical protein